MTPADLKSMFTEAFGPETHTPIEEDWPIAPPVTPTPLPTGLEMLKVKLEAADHVNRRYPAQWREREIAELREKIAIEEHRRERARDRAMDDLGIDYRCDIDEAA